LINANNLMVRRRLHGADDIRLEHHPSMIVASAQPARRSYNGAHICL